MYRFAALVAGVALVAGCGSSYGGSGTTGNSTPTPTGHVINISGLTYSPLKLQVAPGETVTVNNRDAMPHTLTSQTAPGAFTPGAVAGVSFDVSIAGGASATFTIPATAPVGTVIPFFCKVHTSTMATPNGEIDVVASAPAIQDGGTTPPPAGY